MPGSREVQYKRKTIEKSVRKTTKDDEDKEKDGRKNRLKDWKNEEAQVMGRWWKGLKNHCWMIHVGARLKGNRNGTVHRI